MLPCNLIVRQRGTQVEVAAIDARTMLSVTGNTSLEPIAEHVTAQLAGIIDQL